MLRPLASGFGASRCDQVMRLECARFGGVWLSLVERWLRESEVESSNLSTPTTISLRVFAIIDHLFYNVAMGADNPEPTFRWCRLCFERKPLSEFHRRGDGHLHWCKACRKTYDASYYQQRRQEGMAGKRRREA